MSDTKTITEKDCLAVALTLLVKAGELDEQQIADATHTEGYKGLYYLLNTRHKEHYDE